MITPCIGICKLDRATAICIGCGRTYEEIQDWDWFTKETRMEIMRRLGQINHEKQKTIGEQNNN